MGIWPRPRFDDDGLFEAARTCGVGRRVLGYARVFGRRKVGRDEEGT